MTSNFVKKGMKTTILHKKKLITIIKQFRILYIPTQIQLVIENRQTGSMQVLTTLDIEISALIRKGKNMHLKFFFNTNLMLKHKFYSSLIRYKEHI